MITAIMDYVEAKKVKPEASDITPGLETHGSKAFINVTVKKNLFQSQSTVVTLTEDAAEKLIAELVKALRQS